MVKKVIDRIVLKQGSFCQRVVNARNGIAIKAVTTEGGR